jgi:hypothetical protein
LQAREDRHPTATAVLSTHSRRTEKSEFGKIAEARRDALAPAVPHTADDRHLDAVPAMEGLRRFA